MIESSAMYALSQSVQKITNQLECALDSRILLMLQLHSSLTAVYNLLKTAPIVLQWSNLLLLL